VSVVFGNLGGLDLEFSLRCSGKINKQGGLGA